MSTSNDILLVEDEEAIAELLRRVLVRADYTVRIAADGKQALTALEENRPAALILDLILPRMSGFTVLEHMHQQQIIVPIIIITGNPLNQVSLQHPGIVRVLFKPFLIEELLTTLYPLLRYQRSA